MGGLVLSGLKQGYKRSTDYFNSGRGGKSATLEFESPCRGRMQRETIISSGAQIAPKTQLEEGKIYSRGKRKRNRRKKPDTVKIRTQV